MPTLIVLAVLAVLLMITAQFWTEVLWFAHLGFEQVLWQEWGTRAVLFVLGFLVMALPVWLMLRIAYRSRPIYAPVTPEQQNLDRYRESIEPLRRLVMIGAPIVLGVFAGMSVSGWWRNILMWLNREPFGTTDPEFGIDIGFFVFSLPVLRSVVSFLMTVVLISIVAALVTHYLYGGVQISGRSQRITRAARIQLSVLATVFVLLIGANYWLDRYSLMVGDNDRFAGASFADINANLPARTILAIIAVIIAVLFIVSAFRGSWLLPAVGVGVMILSGVVIGGIYPAIVQRFQVAPNAVEAESPFIQRNIDATLAAYGLEELDTQTYAAVTETEAGQLRDDTESTASIRLLDPNIVSPTFRQLQQNRQYYDFASTLAVDRYEIDGEKRDTVIAIRELNQDGLGGDQRTWVNDHTVYTHGFGAVAAYGNTVSRDGQPGFFEYGIPSIGEIGEYEERVYFGQNTPSYSIVGAPEGTEPWELDYPDDSAPQGQVNTTYEGDGGPDVNNLWRKLLFAIRMGSEQILFSDRVNEDSQILYDRDPHERVSKVAPYLTLDARAYPAIVDMDGDESTPKDLVWIVDAYTTTNEYPYSARESLEDATTDALTDELGGVVVGPAPEEVNYIRNSVKAVVNAYDGEVTLYEWDESDPILQTWKNVFPDHISAMDDVSGDLMAHLRYPEDLFKVQRELLSRYHVTDAASFYSGGNFWNIPNDPTAGSANVPQPPYYLTMQMPDQDSAEFSLTSSFIPGGQTDRNILTGFLAVDSETGNSPGEVREGYGQLRLLELPSDVTVPGPGQVQNTFNSNPTISTELNLLQQGGSQVLHGNLLTLPVGGGLLYVQPVYVQASAGTQYPLLQYVLVAFGEEIGFAPTLTEALDQVFGGDSGAEGGDAEIADEVEPEPAPEGEDGAEPDEGATPEAPGTDEGTDLEAAQRLNASLREAEQAMQEAQEAMSAGDWAAYGDAQERLTAALNDAVAAQQEISGGPAPTPIDPPAPEDAEDTEASKDDAGD